MKSLPTLTRWILFVPRQSSSVRWIVKPTPTTITRPPGTPTLVDATVIEEMGETGMETTMTTGKTIIKIPPQTRSPTAMAKEIAMELGSVMKCGQR